MSCSCFYSLPFYVYYSLFSFCTSIVHFLFWLFVVGVAFACLCFACVLLLFTWFLSISLFSYVTGWLFQFSYFILIIFLCYYWSCWSLLSIVFYRLLHNSLLHLVFKHYRFFFYLSFVLSVRFDFFMYLFCIVLLVLLFVVLANHLCTFVMVAVFICLLIRFLSYHSLFYFFLSCCCSRLFSVLFVLSLLFNWNVLLAALFEVKSTLARCLQQFLCRRFCMYMLSLKSTLARCCCVFLLCLFLSRTKCSYWSAKLLVLVFYFPGTFCYLKGSRDHASFIILLLYLFLSLLLVSCSLL